MQPISGANTYLAAQMIGTMLERAKEEKNQQLAVTEAWVTKHVGLVKDNCDRSGLVVSAQLCANLLTYLNEMKPPINHGQFVEHLDTLKNTVHAELQTVRFFRITSEYEKYFDQKQLFGSDVEARFPAASLDIEESGKCLALSRPTAAVFHLIRVMEVGLKALAARLEIPYAPSWESYITQIEKQITQKHALKGVDWKTDEPFFRDMLGDLQAIKISWRNPTMHIVRHYKPDEAEDIFRSVRTFMKRLSEKFSQVVDE